MSEGVRTTLAYNTGGEGGDEESVNPTSASGRSEHDGSTRCIVARRRASKTGVFSALFSRVGLTRNSEQQTGEEECISSRYRGGRTGTGRTTRNGNSPPRRGVGMGWDAGTHDKHGAEPAADAAVSERMETARVFTDGRDNYRSGGGAR